MPTYTQPAPPHSAPAAPSNQQRVIDQLAAQGLIVPYGVRSRRYLVFTSAGEHANLHTWLEGTRNFDLWVTYYGDYGKRFRQVATFYNRRKGSKFQNLHYAYQNWRHLFARYDAIMVMDDDVRITGSEISRLFELRERLDLWLLQPAFRPWGKIRHPITRVDRTARLRYTNFVAMTCPLFRRDKLEGFLNVYDPILARDGIDRWFLETLGADLQGKVAIVDDITCVNPHDTTKGGRREIDRLQPRAERVAIWRQVSAERGIRSDERSQEFRRVPKPPVAGFVGRAVAPAELAAGWLRAKAGHARLKARRLLRRIRHKPTRQT